MYYYKQTDREQIVYLLTYFGVLRFFVCFYVWQILELTFVASLMRRFCIIRFKNRKIEQWVLDFPGLWGKKYVYPLGVRLTFRRQRILYYYPRMIYRRTWDRL